MKWLLLLVCVISVKLGYCSYFDMNEYRMMPKLSRLDDYDRCFEATSNHKPTYCFVDVTIVQNKSNIIWNTIEKFTNDTKHFFRHDRLKRGICINKCHNIFKNMNENERLSLLEKHPFPDLQNKTAYFKNSLIHRLSYGDLVNECINFELKNNYDLMGYSDIFYCDTKDLDNIADFEMDYLSRLFLIITFSLIMLITFSTLYDYRVKFYNSICQDKEILPSTQFKYKFLTSFSLTQSFSRLFSTNENVNNSFGELKVLNGLKCIMMLVIIYIHQILITAIMPSKNPELYEKMHFKFSSMFLFNGPLALQTFFTISSFLLSLHFFEYFETKQPMDFIYFIKHIVNRYLRLIPTYAYLILLNATWLIQLQDGPAWRLLAESEQLFCRKLWWINLLFANNYLGVKTPCMQQGWYLGVDFQLFSITLVFLILYAKYPDWRKTIVVSLFGFSYLVPAIITYVNRLDGVMISTPEHQKLAMRLNPSYDMYISSHGNTGSYLNGAIAGYIWYYYRKGQFNLDKFQNLKHLWHLILPVTSGIIFSGYIFYAFDFEKPAIWIALYSTIVRNVWGVLVSVFIMTMLSGSGGVLRVILTSKICNTLGRLTFSVFLVHTLIIRLLYANIRQPIYVTNTTVIVYAITSTILSYFAGMLLYVGIEIPFGNLTKLLFTRYKNPIKIENHKMIINVGKYRFAINNNTVDKKKRI